MKIALLVEGETERVFLPSLRAFLSRHLARKMPKLIVHHYDGRIPKEDKLPPGAQEATGFTNSPRTAIKKTKR